MYQYIEDNGGGLFLFIFDAAGAVVECCSNLECAPFGEGKDIDLTDPIAATEDWEGLLSNPQRVYNEITGYEFGWRIVADQDGLYPDRMGRAAEYYFGIESE